MTRPASRLAVACGVLLLLAPSGCLEVRARRGIQEGNKAYYDGEYDRAIGEYDSALSRRPDLAIGWFNLGLSHLALFAPGAKTAENDKHAQGAIRAFQAYLALRPQDTQARDYLLSTFIDSGHYEGALKYFEDRLAATANDVNAVAQLAQINAQAGKFDDAVRWHKRRVDMERAAEAKADAWYSIGVLEWRRLHNHPDVQGAERARIADEGLTALARADQLRGNHLPTLSYTNLLYRERALAHGSSIARIVDVATAQVYHKRATELARAAKPAEVAGAKKP